MERVLSRCMFSIILSNDSNFRGQYYDVQNDEVFALSLAIADGSWSTATEVTMTTGLTLTGTRGDESTNCHYGSYSQ